MSPIATKTDPIPVTPGRQEIIDMFGKAIRDMQVVLVGEDFTQASKRRAAEKIADLRSLVKVLRRDNLEWCKKYIPESYKIGLHQDDKLLKRYKGNSYTAQFSKLHKEAAMVAVEGAYRDFTAVADALERTFVGFVEYSKYLGNKRWIAEQIAGGIIEGASRQTVSKRLLDNMQSNVIDGKITVGKVTMNAKAYADLLARTITRAARTEGFENQMNQVGIDLVQISNTGAVDWCRIYEDQIFSLSGNSKKFPKLTLRPPLHPNCTHTLNAFIMDLAEPVEVQRGSTFNKTDVNLSPREMARKYPIIGDDRRPRTKKTQRAA